MAWATQKGSKLPTGMGDSGNWFLDQSGSLACKTNFISRVNVKNPSDEEIPWTSEQKDGDTVIAFDKVVQGSTIEWEIETLADEQKGASDRATVELTYLDTQYLALLINQVMSELTPEEKEKIAAGDKDVLKPYLEKHLDLNLAIVSIWSDTVTTDSEGKASGSIPIDARWPDAAYTFSAHYGYSNLGESATEDKASKFIWEEVVPLVAEITLMIVASVLTAGAATWAAGLVWAARAARAGAMIAAVVDAAVLTKQYLIEGFGVIDQNKYGCSFPLVGYTHVYGINIEFEQAIEDSADLLTNLTGDTEMANAYKNEIYENFVGYALAGAVCLGIVIWAIW
jgi:hypothetical protein